jgi:hypothetical protein
MPYAEGMLDTARSAKFDPAMKVEIMVVAAI